MLSYLDSLHLSLAVFVAIVYGIAFSVSVSDKLLLMSDNAFDFWHVDFAFCYLCLYLFLECV